MRLIRTSVVVVVAIVLLAMAVPAAQARPIKGPAPAVHSLDGAWLASALDNAASWLARLTGNPPIVSRTMKSTTPLPPPTGADGPHYNPMTGPCVDPLGLGRCNN